MTTFKANRKFPNPITVTDDPKSHTLALQQVIEALNIGQRRTKEVNSSYVRVHELVDIGLIEIVGNQLKLTNAGEAAVAGGSTTLAGLTDVDVTGLANGDMLTYNTGTSKWEVGPAPAGGDTILSGAGVSLARGFEVWDDFIVDISSGSGPWPWDKTLTGAGSAAAVVTGEADAPGILRLTSGTATSGNAGVIYGATDAAAQFNPFIVGGGEIIFEARVRFSAAPDGTDSFSSRFGLGSDADGAPTDGIYISTSSTAADFVGVTRAGGSSTLTATFGTIVAATWYYLKIIVSADGTTVDFYLDGVLVATSIAGIPTAGMSLLMNMQKTAGSTSRYAEIDAVRCYQLLTAQRDFIDSPATIGATGPTGPTGPPGAAGGTATSAWWRQDADDAITSNATFQDTELYLGLEVGTYALSAFYALQSHATPGARVRLTFDGTATSRGQLVGTNAASTVISTSWSSLPLDVDHTASAYYTAKLDGVIDVTVAGVLKVQIRQITSDANAITFHAGSWIVATDIELNTGLNIDDEIALDSPTGYWKLDEVSGNFADSSGNGYTLTVTGSPVTAYQFSALDPAFPTRKTPSVTSGGQANYAGNATVFGLSLPITTYTMEMWGRWSVGGIAMGIGASGETLATNFAGQIIISSGGKLSTFWEYGAGTNASITASLFGDLLDGELHHIAVTKDAATRTLSYYIDGIYVGGFTYVVGQEHTGGTSAVFSIFGTPGDSGAGADGQYGGAAFYTTVLSESRIQAHARALRLF